MISVGVEDKLTLAGSMFSKTTMTGISFSLGKRGPDRMGS